MTPIGFEEAMRAIAPLRLHATELQQRAVTEHEAALKRWEQSERPVLKEHASGMRDTLQVLMKEHDSLRNRIASMSSTSVRNHPGTSTGFNVIRSRTDSMGQPLSTEELRKEKERLSRSLDSLEVDIAAVKAEIMADRRSEEHDIWETKLVALQDTKRVYREEINLIEVELLGREHYERMQEQRLIEEETGTARLRRIQEQMLQTRIKYNKAKHQFYFPNLKGFK